MEKNQPFLKRNNDHSALSYHKFIREGLFADKDSHQANIFVRQTA